MYKSSTQTRSQTRRRTVSIVEWIGSFLRNQHEPNAEDFLFASQIDAETLNRIIEEGPNKGESVAFALASTSEGQSFLAHNNFTLGSQITAETLNHVIEEGPNKGQSVAFCLAGSPEGALLAYDDYKLGKRISIETFNHPIYLGPYRKVTITEMLERTVKGRESLEHRNQETMLSRLYSMFTKPRGTPSSAYTPL